MTDVLSYAVHCNTCTYMRWQSILRAIQLLHFWTEKRNDKHRGGSNHTPRLRLIAAGGRCAILIVPTHGSSPRAHLSRTRISGLHLIVQTDANNTHWIISRHATVESQPPLQAAAAAADATMSTQTQRLFSAYITAALAVGHCQCCVQCALRCRKLSLVSVLA